MSHVLSQAINEKDVENTYRQYFHKKFGKDTVVTSPFGCDGFGVSKTHKVKTLMEFKDNFNLSNRTELCKVLAQSIFYIKKFYDKGMIPPSTIFIADRDECTTLHVNDVLGYLDMDINWNVAPSSAHTVSELMIRLISDTKINPFIFNVNDLDKCLDKTKELTTNIQRKVLVTDKNITEVFRYFDEKVLAKTKLSTNERANLFVQILVNKDENYLVGASKIKKVHTKSFGQIAITSRESYISFFEHFSSSYSPSQKHRLSAVVDRIVEDTTRRKQGEFFTPIIWVDKAHEYITSVYGDDWKEKYVVWDPAWGTGNLTRDYQFNELYVSTLNQSDIDTANQMGYNPEAVKFQYDFLNDGYEKLPDGLRKAIEEGRQIIILMNPPYGTSSTSAGNHKEGTSLTKTNELMNTEKLGKGSQQLYAQFLYKLHKMNIKNICLFAKPNFFSSSGFVDFRKKIWNNYEFLKGFVMNASEFADVKTWPLSFTIWKIK